MGWCHYTHFFKERIELIVMKSRRAWGGEFMVHKKRKKKRKEKESKRVLSVEVGGVTGSEWVGV